jgi:hypothetical protein
LAAISVLGILHTKRVGNPKIQNSGGAVMAANFSANTWYPPNLAALIIADPAIG